MSPEADRTRDAVDSEPKQYQLSYSGPLISNINVSELRDTQLAWQTWLIIWIYVLFVWIKQWKTT